MFHPYCAGGEFLGLASLWSANNRWLGSQQPLRHVAWFVAPSTQAEERLPHRASACLYVQCIPDLRITLLVDATCKWKLVRLHLTNKNACKTPPQWQNTYEVCNESHCHTYWKSAVVTPARLGLNHCGTACVKFCGNWFCTVCSSAR